MLAFFTLKIHLIFFTAELSLDSSGITNCAYEISLKSKQQISKALNIPYVPKNLFRYI